MIQTVLFCAFCGCIKYSNLELIYNLVLVIWDLNFSLKEMESR